jgi:hypothetical protein
VWARARARARARRVRRGAPHHAEHRRARDAGAGPRPAARAGARRAGLKRREREIGGSVSSIHLLPTYLLTRGQRSELAERRARSSRRSTPGSYYLLVLLLEFGLTYLPYLFPTAGTAVRSRPGRRWGPGPQRRRRRRRRRQRRRPRQRRRHRRGTWSTGQGRRMGRGRGRWRTGGWERGQGQGQGQALRPAVRKRCVDDDDSAASSRSGADAGVTLDIAIGDGEGDSDSAGGADSASGGGGGGGGGGIGRRLGSSESLAFGDLESALLDEQPISLGELDGAMDMIEGGASRARAPRT